MHVCVRAVSLRPRWRSSPRPLRAASAIRRSGHRALRRRPCWARPTNGSELVAFRTAYDRTVRYRPVRYELVASRADGRLVRVLVGGTERDRLRPALFERAAWSPDGRRLAFTAELGELADFPRDIYVIRADGSGRRRLTTGGRSFHPVWSPNGGRIFFARRRKAAHPEAPVRLRESASIWSMRSDGSQERRVTRLIAGRSDVPESFSPDGSALALTRTTNVTIDERGRMANTAEVWVMRPDGSHARRLADRSADPAFSPDGERIAFASDRDQNGELSYGDLVRFANELYVMRADGSNQLRLTRTEALNELQPSWLPGGARIAYQRGQVIDNAEGTVIMQANADGTCARTILADPRLRTWYAAPVSRPRSARAGDRALRC
jgi:Tol biopolymer transport system component